MSPLNDHTEGGMVFPNPLTHLVVHPIHPSSFTTQKGAWYCQGSEMLAIDCSAPPLTSIILLHRCQQVCIINTPSNTIRNILSSHTHTHFDEHNLAASMSAGINTPSNAIRNTLTPPLEHLTTLTPLNTLHNTH